jgi:hypothetical protein
MTSKNVELSLYGNFLSDTVLFWSNNEGSMQPAAFHLSASVFQRNLGHPFQQARAFAAASWIQSQEVGT